MNTKLIKLTVTTTGGAGAATGTARAGVPNGKLLAVGVDYNAAAPATTVVALTCTHPLAKTLFAPAATATDKPLQNVTEVELDTAGAARATPATRHQYVAGELVATVTLSDALAPALTLYALIEVAG